MGRNRTWSWLAGAVLGVAGLLVGLNAGGHAGAQGGEGASAQAQTADVTLDELTINPSTIRLEVARPAVLRVHNAGQNESLRLPALAPGNFAAWCGVPGHREAGMTATIEVDAGTGGSGGTGGTGGTDGPLGYAINGKGWPATRRRSPSAASGS